MNHRHLCVLLVTLALFGLIACDDIGDEGVKKVGPLGTDSLANGPGPADEDAPTEFTTTESGLRYRILRKGDGDKPRAVDNVTVHYRGWLDDGTIFDESYAKGKTASFNLGGVIAGWTEGLQLVAKGGMIELELPPGLAYGESGSGPIPANSTLHFIVELYDIEAAPEATGGAPPPRRSPETEAMLEGFIRELPGAATDDNAAEKKDDAATDSTSAAEKEVDGEAAGAGEQKSDGDAAVE